MRNGVAKTLAVLAAVAVILTSTRSAFAATWVNISGTVVHDRGAPVCAMVLANGQNMFSCDGSGSYRMRVPLNKDGEINLFSFASGFEPYRITLEAEEADGFVVYMEKGGPDAIVAVDVNGVVLGRVLDASPSRVSILNPKGYTVAIDSFEGEVYRRGISSIWYSDSSCGLSGGTLLVDEYSKPRGILPRPKHLPASSPKIYYLPDEPERSIYSQYSRVNSYNGDSGGMDCKVDQGDKVFAPLLPNDPAVTGIPNHPYAEPITLK